MHGMIFSELQNYAETKHGRGTWNALLKKANLENRVYLPVQEYPDTDAVSLVMAASAMTGLPVSAVLEDFGQFIVPSLSRIGIGAGLRQHFQEKIVATQTMCMHKGATRCEILFRKV